MIGTQFILTERILLAIGVVVGLLSSSVECHDDFSNVHIYGKESYKY